MTLHERKPEEPFGLIPQGTMELSPEVALYRHLMKSGYPRQQSSAGIVWLGTNTLWFRAPDVSILIDPYFSRLPVRNLNTILFKSIQPDNPRISVALHQFGISELTAILLTHTHLDHALDVPHIAQMTGTQYLLAPPLLARYYRKNRESFQVIDSSTLDTIELNGIRITIHKGRHMPFILPIYNMESWFNGLQTASHLPEHVWSYTADALYSYKLDFGNQSFFITGSAGLPCSALQGIEADIVILSVGGLDMLPGKYCDQVLSEMVDSLHPREVWLSHWDDFTIPLDKPIKWLGKANRIVDYIVSQNRSKGLSTYVLPPGKPVGVG